MRARLTAIAMVGALVVGLAQPAGADTPQEKLDRAQARLHDLSSKLEIQIEECNTRREQYKAAKQAVKDNRADYDRVRSDLASVASQRGKAVAAMYKQSTGGGGHVETLASPASDINEYAERIALLDLTAKAHTTAFERYAATEDQLEASSEVLEATEAQAEQADADAQETCEATKAKVEAEEEKVSDLSAEVERLEAAARRRAAAREDDSATVQETSGGGGGGGGGTPKVSGNAAGAVAFARSQLGKPYSWGGEGPGSYDCSGLTMAAWAAAGTSLPHSSSMQYSSTARVSRGALQPGDLLFYGSPIHHVAIYIGGGEMIEAPHSGAVVRIASIDRSDYVGAGRP